MAGFYNEQLKELHEKVLIKQHMDTMLEDIYLQRQQISMKVNEFKETKISAEQEAARLEKGGLAGLLAGKKKDEKIAAARKRALNAKLKIDAMDAAMDAIYNESMKCREAMKGLDNCVPEYQQMLEEKKAAGSSEGNLLAECELRLSELRAAKREMKEAADTGEAARAAADRILANLEGADSWASWDLFGGGALADATECGKLEIVQKEVGALQGQLQNFRAELIDVKFSMDLNYAIDGFTRFADWFFDGIFVDWTGKEPIGRAKEETQHFIDQMEKVQKKLAEFQAENEKELAECEKEMEALG